MRHICRSLRLLLLSLWLQSEADALVQDRPDSHLLVNPLMLPDPHVWPYKVNISTFC
jgi:hypothetical protein